MVYCMGKLVPNLQTKKLKAKHFLAVKLFYKSNEDGNFYGFIGVLYPLGVFGLARDFETFLEFSQHPAWVITPGNLKWERSNAKLVK